MIIIIIIIPFKAWIINGIIYSDKLRVPTKAPIPTTHFQKALKKKNYIT